jgi:phosphoribosyl-dephospho-CoA transferase
MADGTHKRTSFKRHDLLDVSDAGRSRILDDLTALHRLSDKQRALFACVLLQQETGTRVPGVVRREDGPAHPGLIPVGFSSPTKKCGKRLRVAAFVRPEEIVRVTSPYDVLSLRGATLPHNACTEALAAAKDRAQSMGLLLGVWGSAALEIQMGQRCTDDDSDLDLLLAETSIDKLLAFLGEVSAMEDEHKVRIDVELDLTNGYGVHLKELFGKGRSVLGKGKDDVVMLSREQVLAGLPSAGCKNGCEGTGD